VCSAATNRKTSEKKPRSGEVFCFQGSPEKVLVDLLAMGAAGMQYDSMINLISSNKQWFWF